MTRAHEPEPGPSFDRSWGHGWPLDRPFTAALLLVFGLELGLGVALQYAPPPAPLGPNEAAHHWVVLVLERPTPAVGEVNPEAESSRAAPPPPPSPSTPTHRTLSAPPPPIRPVPTHRPVPPPRRTVERHPPPTRAAFHAALEQAVGLALGHSTPAPPARTGSRATGAPILGPSPRPGGRSGLGAHRPGDAEVASLWPFGAASSGGDGLELTAKQERSIGGLPAPPPAAVMDELSAERASDLIQANMTGIRACYRRALRRQRSAGGKIVVRAQVLRGGRAARTEIVQDHLGRPEVTDCLSNKVMAWEFPDTGQGAYRATLTFILADRG